MGEEITAAGKHPAVVASMAVAWVAVAAVGLVAIAYFLGWLPHRDELVPATAGPATAKTATTQSGVVLLPGETLVAAPDPVAATAPSPAAVAPAAVPDKRAPGPTTPRYTKSAPPRPTSFERSVRSVCVNCGVVAEIRRGDYDWEVRVRFDDGSRETLRYYDRPRLKVGDAVHLEDGRLVPD
jgi:hypothetical protein